MDEESAQIRLPELAIFKRYSLALRQEFADLEEFVAVLEKSYAQAVERMGVDGDAPARTLDAGAARRDESEPAASNRELANLDPGGDATQAYLKDLFPARDLFAEDDIVPADVVEDASAKASETAVRHADEDVEASFWGKEKKSVRPRKSASKAGKTAAETKRPDKPAAKADMAGKPGKKSRERPSSRKVVRVGRKGEALPDEAVAKDLNKLGE